MKQRISILLLVGLCCLNAGCNNRPDIDIPEVNRYDPNKTKDTTFYRGVSMTFASYLEDTGGKVYKEQGKPCDPYVSVKAHGGNMVRLILEPETPDRTAGMNAAKVPDIDWMMIDRVEKDMLRAKNAGLDVVLTLKLEKYVCHSWEHITDRTELGDTLYRWCYDVLERLVEQNTVPKIVGIGNEINAAFMSPETELNNNVYDYERNVYFINRGLDAVAAVNKKFGTDMKTTLHIFSPDNIKWWFDVHKGLHKFDIMSLSYYVGYPGHSISSWKSYAEITSYFAGKGMKWLMLETSYPYTNRNADSQTNAYYADLDYATGTFSATLQRKFLAAMAQSLRNAGAIGMITWGNESLPTDAYIYADDSWGKGSTWENNSYWDADCNLHEGIDWMGDLTAK